MALNNKYTSRHSLAIRWPNIFTGSGSPGLCCSPGAIIIRDCTHNSPTGSQFGSSWSSNGSRPSVLSGGSGQCPCSSLELSIQHRNKVVPCNTVVPIQGLIPERMQCSKGVKQKTLAFLADLSVGGFYRPVCYCSHVYGLTVYCLAMMSTKI